MHPFNTFNVRTISDLFYKEACEEISTQGFKDKLHDMGYSVVAFRDNKVKVRDMTYGVERWIEC